MDETQRKALLSEYPEAKKILIYHDVKKKIVGTVRIYVTKNFLFVPGLLLAGKDEISKIVAFNAFTPAITTFVFYCKNQPRKELVLYYRFKVCPETAEQIMAWFWNCNSDDVELKEKVRNIINSPDRGIL